MWLFSILKEKKMSIDFLFSITEIAVVFSCAIYIFVQCLLMHKIYLDKVVLILLCLLLCLVGDAANLLI